MPKCRARNKGDNKLCKHKVSKAGERCAAHPGMTEAAPPRRKQARPRSSRPRRARSASTAPRTKTAARQARTRARKRDAEQKKRQKRVEAAAKVFQEVATKGWQETVANKATTYVSEHT